MSTNFSENELVHDFLKMKNLCDISVFVLALFCPVQLFGARALDILAPFKKHNFRAVKNLHPKLRLWLFCESRRRWRHTCACLVVLVTISIVSGASLIASRWRRRLWEKNLFLSVFSLVNRSQIDLDLIWVLSILPPKVRAPVWKWSNFERECSTNKFPQSLNYFENLAFVTFCFFLVIENCYPDYYAVETLMYYFEWSLINANDFKVQPNSFLLVIERWCCAVKG